MLFEATVDRPFMDEPCARKISSRDEFHAWGSSECVVLDAFPYLPLADVFQRCLDMASFTS